MTKIFVAANDTYTHASANTGDTISGNGGGRETVILQGNPTGTILDGNFEAVQLAGTAATTTLQVNATTGRLELASGGTVFATFSGGLNQAVDLQFTDGNVTLTQTGANAFTITTPGSTTGAVTINTTTPQTGSAVTLGADKSTATTTTVAEGQTLAYTTGTTDILIGNSGNDTFTGTATTYQDTDRVIDSSSTDADTLNLTVTADVTPDVVKVETVNITQNSLSPIAVDVSKFSGVSTLNVTRGDVVVGGSTLTGNKAVKVDAVDAANLTKIVAGAGTTALDINGTATGKAGVNVDASTVTTTVTVDGAATILANAATGTVAVDAVSNTTAAETGKATSITANAAATVTTHADLTGSVTINAAKAATVTVNDAQGGATVTAATTSTADSTITVLDIDSSGATVVTGKGSSVAAEKQITVNLDGTTATTDTASVSGDGVIALDLDFGTTDTVDIVTLSGSSEAVTYNIIGNAPTSITKAGTQSVTVAGDEGLFSGVTVSGLDVLDLNAGTAATIDSSKWTSVGTVDLGFDNTGFDITVSEGAHYTVTANQGGAAPNLDFLYTTGAKNMTIVAGDVNGTANTTVGTLSITGDLTVSPTGTDAGIVSIIADESNLTVGTNTKLGAKQDLKVSGDEDVSLGTVTAQSVDASASTGNIVLTAATGVTNTVATGSGADQLTANGGDIHSFAAGAGNDTITITNTQATSQFDGGAGDDQIAANKDGIAYIVIGGDGNDTVTTAVDIDAILVGGNGTDTFTIGEATLDLADNVNFSFSGFEAFNISAATGATTISAAQLANNSTFAITATGDQLNVEVDPAGANRGGTLDASGITIASGSTATLNYVGSTKTDTITGGVENEIFTMTAGDDVITGGTKSGDADQFIGANVADNGTATGVAINLGTTAITGTQILSVTGLRTASDSSIAAGTAASLFNDTLSTNNAAITTLSGIENITGASGKDYLVGNSSNNVITGGGGSDFIDGGAGSDTIVLTAKTDGAAEVTVADITAGAADFDAATADVINFVKADDTIRIDGALEALLEAAGVTAISSTTASLDYNAAGIFIIAAAQGKLAGDNFGDVSAVAAAFNTGNGTAANATAGDEIIFTLENNAGTKTGVYYFVDVDGNNDFSNNDKVTLLGVIQDVGLTASDIII